ncbi:MAG: glycosyltransferase family 4 protein [Candidatus Riflebacteria bacterium]|nr:glycosyltransferase family 4 protein [Candidatus Riflebacteria bacterium]
MPIERSTRTGGDAGTPGPRTAYVLLWFPKPSETFIFNEVVNLWHLGLPLKVFTLYGALAGDLSPEMAGVQVPVERLGLSGLGRLIEGVWWWWRRDRGLVLTLVREIAIRRWRSLEFGGENLWSFLCGFHLARRFLQEGIDHIHAPWALGVATTAWVASRLTGIPFSFTGRSHDIFPPDGALAEKMEAATLVRAESEAALEQMATAAPGQRAKLVLTYNGVPLAPVGPAEVAMKPPVRLLAVGRLVRTKGFGHLLAACRCLAKQQVEFELTLAGSGWLDPWLRLLVRRLGLTGRVRMPGFVTHDRVGELYARSDIFVMPSVVSPDGNRDGLPTVLLEALLHRVPAVATSISGLGEIVRHRVTGLVVPPADPEAIAGAVTWMIAHRAEAVAMADRGRQRVLDRFDPDKNHRRLLELYGGVRQAAGP